MKRKYHLRSKDSPRELFRRGTRSDYPTMRIIKRRNNLNHARFVLMVPRSLDKRSSVRNRLRRRTGEFIRTNFSHLLSKPMDVLVVFKKRSTELTQNEFYRELKKNIPPALE